MKSIILGGGCFWCLEAIYKQVNGVVDVVSGYSGGDYKNPTYEDLLKYETGHAEVIKIDYDESVITLPVILKIFWHIHNPTTKDRQGNDVGKQYRSIIIYSEDQLPIINKSIKDIAEVVWDRPITTEKVKLTKFYPAEDYHQDYFLKNPGSGYCQVIINPKLSKFRKTFGSYLK